jgi:hypothetical protein
MKAMFDCSWAALSPREQEALLSLSLFRSSFALAAAQAITDIAPPVLLALHAKSWLQAQRLPQLSPTDDQLFAPPTRYKIPRLFTHHLARMAGSPAHMAQLHRAHAHYFTDYLHKRVARLLDTSCRSCHLLAIQAERENLAQARDWAAEHRDEQLLAQLERDLAHFHMLKEGHRRRTPQQHNHFERMLHLEHVQPLTT